MLSNSTQTGGKKTYTPNLAFTIQINEAETKQFRLN